MTPLKYLAIPSIALLIAVAPSRAVSLYDLNSVQTSGSSQNTYSASTTNAGGGSGSGTAGSFSGSLPTNLIFTSGAAFAGGGDYFIGKFAETTLANVGDILTLSFTVLTNNISSTAAQDIRFGLFEIGTATTGADVSGTNSFSAATGYRVDYGAASTLNGIRERTGSSLNLFTSSISPLVGTQTSSNFTLTPANATTYSGSLTLTLLEGNQVEITSKLGDLTQSTVTDTVSAFTTFNAFGVYAVSSGSAARLNFTSLDVDFQAVPEPASTALILFGIAGICIYRRRFTGSILA